VNLTLFWLIAAVLAVGADCLVTWYLISHHAVEADDNPLIRWLADKWGYRTALAVSFAVRIGAVVRALAYRNYDAVVWVFLPALIAAVIAAGNYYLGKRK
jgi:Cu/Ag efflux pump CusA